MGEQSNPWPAASQAVPGEQPAWGGSSQLPGGGSPIRRRCSCWVVPPGRGHLGPRTVPGGCGVQGPPSRLGWLRVGTGGRKWVVVGPKVLPHWGCIWASRRWVTGPKVRPCDPHRTFPQGLGYPALSGEARLWAQGRGVKACCFPPGKSPPRLSWSPRGSRGATEASQRAGVVWALPLPSLAGNRPDLGCCLALPPRGPPAETLC